MKKMTDFQRLIDMAEEYKVHENALFLCTSDTYIVQKKAIDLINKALDVEELTVEKQYVKNGSKNVYMNPAIKDLPKHADSLNKTATQLLNIIKDLGSKAEKKSRLQEFRDR